MDRIPTEVWAMVFGNLEISLDIHAVYNTCQIWRNVLQPSWMFGHVFPQLQQYLSVGEALKCRRVCKEWLAAVDSFLLKHAHCRIIYPQAGSLQHLCKAEERLGRECCPVRIFKSMINIYRRDRMIRHVSNYSSSRPLVGRWFEVYLSGRAPLPRHEIKFVDSFGSHIWFLRCNLRFDPALDSLKMLLKFLPLFPNLKGLQLSLILEISPLTYAEMREQLKNYLETRPAMELINKLPKSLEALEMENTHQLDDGIKTVMFELFVSTCKKFQSVAFRCMSDVACLQTPACLNIVDLSVRLASSATVQQMLQLKLPLRRLQLSDDSHEVSPEDLFRIAKHFRESVRCLLVEIDMLEEMRMDFQRHSEYMKPLVNREILNDLKHVTRMTLQGFFILSLNFLCGLSRRLEYLHIMLVLNSDSTDQDNPEKHIRQRIQFTEELDLLERLKQFVQCEDRQVVYGSNVWKVFPKLRELTVQCTENEDEMLNAQEFQFRRDIYDYNLRHLAQN